MKIDIEIDVNFVVDHEDIFGNLVFVDCVLESMLTGANFRE